MFLDTNVTSSQNAEKFRKENITCVNLWYSMLFLFVIQMQFHKYFLKFMSFLWV